jgi:hypothetical protein
VFSIQSSVKYVLSDKFYFHIAFPFLFLYSFVLFFLFPMFQVYIIIILLLMLHNNSYYKLLILNHVMLCHIKRGWVGGQHKREEPTSITGICLCANKYTIVASGIAINSIINIQGLGVV